jgi:hypothetical protein
LACLATGFLFPGNILANSLATEDEQRPDNGLVFLFQSDSITYGNRGRNADPNHIMGHGYAFAVASRRGADFPCPVLLFITGASVSTRFQICKSAGRPMSTGIPYIVDGKIYQTVSGVLQGSKGSGSS